MYQNDSTRVLTGEARASYVHLIAPYANPSQPNAKPKYSVTLLIPKTDIATKADIDAAIEAAAQKATTEKWGGVRPPMLKQPVWDGDGVRQSGVAFGPECKGCWVLTASSEYKPGVVGIDNINCELAPQDIYSGMWVRATLQFFGYLNSGSKGVGCGLGNVLKIRDDEALAGRASASSDFAGIGQSVIPESPVAPPQLSMPSVGTPIIGNPATQPSNGYPVTPPTAYPGGYPNAATAAYPGAVPSATIQQPRTYIDPVTGEVKQYPPF